MKYESDNTTLDFYNKNAFKYSEETASLKFDDRQNMSIGVKIKDSKIVGAPYTVVAGRSLDRGVLEIENNATGEKVEVKLEEFINYCKEL